MLLKLSTFEGNQFCLALTESDEISGLSIIDILLDTNNTSEFRSLYQIIGNLSLDGISAREALINILLKPEISYVDWIVSPQQDPEHIEMAVLSFVTLLEERGKPQSKLAKRIYQQTMLFCRQNPLKETSLLELLHTLTKVSTSLCKLILHDWDGFLQSKQIEALAIWVNLSCKAPL